jgi:hypothetical protein
MARLPAPRVGRQCRPAWTGPRYNVGGRSARHIRGRAGAVRGEWSGRRAVYPAGVGVCV